MASKDRKLEGKTWRSEFRSNPAIAVSILSLCAATYLGLQNYRLNAETRSAETLGILDGQYYGVDLHIYCDRYKNALPGSSGGQPANGEMEAVHDVGEQTETDRYDIHAGYVQNAIWNEAESRLKSYCGKVRWYDSNESDRPDATPITQATLVFLEVENNSGLYNISPTARVDSMPASGEAPIWAYAHRAGKAEDIPLGPIAKGNPVRLPVAIVTKRVPSWGQVAVPREFMWTSPITNETKRLPLGFIVDGRSWRSIREGVTGSGAPVN